MPRDMSSSEATSMRTLGTAVTALLVVCLVLPAASAESALAADLGRVNLASPLRAPMELAVASDQRVFWVERAGRLMVYEPREGTTREVGSLDVATSGEHGLLGLALDPRFADNGWIYLAHSRTIESGVELRVSRFTMSGEALDAGSEQVLLSVPTQGGCCHAAGSLAFGPDGSLYLSTGDDTHWEGAEGYAPIDERPGREILDAQRSSGNTMDLRGKILRIRPGAEGGYTIPEDNLFPGGSGGRPEIYAMGMRNPFRFSLDSSTGWIYFGDVGPDAETDSVTRGPRGYDEINRARDAGNYGWPYCIADNKPYLDYDLATALSGPPFECSAPTNNSPNNSGSSELPPARRALLWYPYAESSEFPELGSGGRTALAGPIYRPPPGGSSARALPSDYDGNLFIYDWMRSWIKIVRFDESGEPVEIDPFGSEWEFRRPIDMELGADGALYVLEWGTGYDGLSDDSGLYRIESKPASSGPSPGPGSEVTPGPSPAPTPASGTALDLSSPLLSLGTGHRQRVLRNHGVTVRLRCDEPCSYRAYGRLDLRRRGRKIGLRQQLGRLPEDRRARLRLRLSRPSARSLRRALGGGRRVRVRVIVRVRDGAGNLTKRTRLVRLTR